MRILAVRLQPFGGLTNCKIAFGPGLNVVLGPNEAGKSTIFHAIQNVLFTPAKLRKPEFTRVMKRFVPLGGDTCRVELTFQVEGKVYRLERSWGATVGAWLVLPDGAQLTEEAEIDRRLKDLLPASAATFRSTLLTYQSGLEKTVRELAERFPETIYSLGDILRQALFETGGVSVDRFQAELEERYRAYFSRWDRERHRPEGNRGVGNRWLKGTGRVVEAWYRQEELRRELEEARRVEEEIDRTNQQLKEKVYRKEEIEIFLKQHRPVVESLQQRQVLEAEIGQLEAQLEKLKGVNQSWPVLEHRIDAQRTRLQELNERAKALRSEKDRAEAQARSRQLRERFEQARKQHRELEAAREALREAKKITVEDLQQIRQLYREWDRLESRLQAGELRVKLQVRKRLSFTIQEDLQPAREVTLEPPAEQVFEAHGQIRLQHPDWEVRVMSGKVDFAALEMRFREVREELKKWQKKFGFRSLEEAEALHQDFREKSRQVELARQALQEILGEESFEALRTAVESLGKEQTTRPLADAAAELARTEVQIRQAEKELEEWQQQVEQFREAYGSPDELLIQVGELTRRRRERRQQLAALPSLPKEIARPEQLLEEYQRKKATRETLEAEIHHLERKLFELEREMPNRSAEELEQEYREAERVFRRVLREGEALARIRAHTREILATLDRDTFRGLEQELSLIIRRLTGGRYRQVALEENLPRAFVRSDGKELPYELLSYGTRDVLGLALRLTIGKYFLQQSDGPFVLDDPLVDLDPDRQRAAAAVLQEFAAEKQVIIFTCHPAHAKLLGGKVIELEV